MFSKGAFDRSVLLAVFGVLLACVLLVLLQGILAASGHTLIATDFNTSGLFGDSFGPVSALMASIAAVGAWSAVRLQHKELEDFRERADVDQQSQAQRDFEARFFGLLENFDNLVAAIRCSHGPGTGQTGRPALTALTEEVSSRLLGRPKKEHLNIYYDWFDGRADELGHYFRFLYHLTIYTDHTSNNATQDMLFLRAKLSESELVLVALNCAYGEGKEKFKWFVEKYHLLHNMTAQSKLALGFDELFADRAFEPGMSGKFLGAKLEQKVIRSAGFEALYRLNNETDKNTYRDKVADNADLPNAILEGKISVAAAGEILRDRKRQQA
jgi:hypothetical protein